MNAKKIELLERLHRLKESGALSLEEFEAEKRKVLVPENDVTEIATRENNGEESPQVTDHKGIALSDPSKEIVTASEIRTTRAEPTHFYQEDSGDTFMYCDKNHSIVVIYRIENESYAHRSLAREIPPELENRVSTVSIFYPIGAQKVICD